MFRLIAMYDDVRGGTSIYFGNNLGQYQSFMILVVAALVVIYIVKYFMLNMAILLASSEVHDRMVDSILHSPAGFFDTTPSGVLINKFSNDLGLIDYSLFFHLNYTVEGPIAVVISVINIALINFYFVVPSILLFLACFFFFKYCNVAH